MPLFCAGGIATPADAALVMQLGAEAVFVGSGIFKSDNPAPRAKAIVEATTNFRDPHILAKVSRGLGDADDGDQHGRADGQAGRAGLVTVDCRRGEAPRWRARTRRRCDGRACQAAAARRRPALQGAFAAHRAVLARSAPAVEVRTPADLAAVDALVLPGGESTTISMLLDSQRPARAARATRSSTEHCPTLGTCAGMIVLARTILDGRDDQVGLDAIDISVRRNAFGRQVDSFEADLDVAGLPGGPFPAVFIRAPVVEERRSRRGGPRHGRRAVPSCAVRARAWPPSTPSCRATTASTACCSTELALPGRAPRLRPPAR